MRIYHYTSRYEVPGVTFISDCLAAKTAQNKEKGAEKWHKVCT
jgi:hypothetical protein